MVLEPFSALAVATAVVQFVDFGSKAVSKGWELSQSADGTLPENVELTSVVNHLRGIASELKSTASDFERNRSYSVGNRLTSFGIRGNQAFSRNESALNAICSSCERLANKLLAVLDDLTVREPRKKWQSVRKALKSVWKESEIHAMEQRLSSLRSELILSLLKVLSDKQSTTISQLDQLSRRNEDIGINHSDDLRRMREELLASVEGIHASIRDQRLHTIGHEPDLKQMSSVMRGILREIPKNEATQRLLHSLSFSTMRNRQRGIPPAHARTFEWIFCNSPSMQSQPKLNFAEWLRLGRGAFWIAGKAGSGKSTLMNFLLRHPNTQLLLRSWAGSKKLMVASYFFWSAGDSMQYSLTGLLRSLLYDILRQCPRMIPLVCPSRWELPQGGYEVPAVSWHYNELTEAFSNLMKQDFSGLRFCFFIDGLDEYRGEDHADVINILNQLTTLPHIKLCVSSRSWNIFTDHYGRNDNQMLKLEDLTREDIRHYVREKLEQNPIFIQLQASDSRHQLLVEIIVERAQGVFFWVFLVIRALSRGLTNADTFATLKARIEALPRDLKTYFQLMLENIEDLYRPETAQIFFMRLASDKPPLLFTFYFLGDDSEGAVRWDDEEVTQKRMVMEKRVKARCQDLLEVLPWYDLVPNSRLIECRVEFLHRTVRDFLLTTDVQQLLAMWLPPHFDASRSLCQGICGIIKALPLPSKHLCLDTMDIFAEEIMYFQSRMGPNDPASFVAMCEDMDTCLSQHWVCEYERNEILGANLTIHTLNDYQRGWLFKRPEYNPRGYKVPGHATRGTILEDVRLQEDRPTHLIRIKKRLRRLCCM